MDDQIIQLIKSDETVYNMYKCIATLNEVKNLHSGKY